MFRPLCSEAAATGPPSSLAPGDVQQLKEPTVQRGGLMAVGLEFLGQEHNTMSGTLCTSRSGC